MRTDPDAIRADIERTRSELSRDVNALGEAVTPGNVARRQVDKVRDAAGSVKDHVMGSASDLGDSATGMASGAASGVGDAAHDAKQAAARRARGNPLAAGFVALGVGWLVGSLLPASAKERELSETVKDRAQPALDEAKSVAKESAEHLREPAQAAVAEVKDRAQAAVENVTDEGRQAADDVRASAAESRDVVQEQRHG
ncbi:hypothetical protein N865_18670 [Intrasporangium oryzae NRRL B-24470]|uniref:DUF3618 domain-containing protein n=2 Tax=Intrasporangium TaxID=53357 RepID=W9GH88_9MICO|nr:hypothetical protein N865_18670 [Intrasporangium oryzae NRRL B-24470]